MAAPSQTPVAGGAIIALGIIVGAVVGYVVRQPTIGFLLGLGAGVLASLLIWWRDRAR